jgi:ComEC/Rec2-related protein
VEGWIAELPTERIWQNGGKAMETELEATSLFGETGWERTSGRVLLRVDPSPEKMPRVGEVVRVAGYLALPERARNPGEFDRVRHLQSRGLDYILRVRPGEMEGCGEKQGVWLAKMAAGLREHMLKATSLGLREDPEASGLIAAMLFGYRDGVGEELRESFRATGTLHLFAVSGQNLAVVAGLLLWILALTGAVKWRWAWATLPAVFLFCLATGMEASAARAFLMTGVLYLGWMMGRPMDPANWLGSALLALLIWDPRQVGDTGFQLSFLVVAGLMVLAGPLQARLLAWGRPDLWIPSRLVAPWRRAGQKVWVVVATIVATSAAAWVGSLIPGIALFHQITPVALAANVVAAPIAGAVTVLAAVSSMMAPFFSVGAIGMNLMNARLVHLLAGVLGWMATWPGGHFAVADPRVWFERAPVVEIVAVEGAAPTLVRGEGGKWLIEPGSKMAWANSVRPFLNYYGVNRLDGVILTAGLAKRSGCAEELMGSMPIGWWGESGLGGRSGLLKGWRSQMVEKKEGRRFFKTGDRVELGKEWRVEVLWPMEGTASGRAEEDGLVMRLECGEARILWAGSIPGEVEEKLVEKYGEKLRAGVLVQEPSQGGNLTAEWLRAVRPNYLIRAWKALEDDPSLSVDFDQISKEIGMTLVKLKESGAVRLKPEPQSGGWEVRKWKSE